MAISSGEKDRPPHEWGENSKVDTVCQRIQEVIEEDAGLGESLFIPLISCIVKSSKSSVDQALLRIQAMRGQNTKLAEEALQFLILLVDVNQVCSQTWFLIFQKSKCNLIYFRLVGGISFSTY